MHTAWEGVHAVIALASIPESMLIAAWGCAVAQGAEQHRQSKCPVTTKT